MGRPLRSEAEFHDVRRAVMACPVGAIKWVKRPKLQARPLQEGYPKVREKEWRAFIRTLLDQQGITAYHITSTWRAASTRRASHLRSFLAAWAT